MVRREAAVALVLAMALTACGYHKKGSNYAPASPGATAGSSRGY